ncbi:MAG: hypothetical protein C3F15_07920 [Holophagae bacterium]|nr:MAG: hypothetical protein C3F15_07920 [Holophagae bacterium]
MRVFFVATFLTAAVLFPRTVTAGFFGETLRAGFLGAILPVGFFGATLPVGFFAAILPVGFFGAIFLPGVLFAPVFFPMDSISRFNSRSRVMRTGCASMTPARFRGRRVRMNSGVIETIVSSRCTSDSIFALSGFGSKACVRSSLTASSCSAVRADLLSNPRT